MQHHPNKGVSIAHAMVHEDARAGKQGSDKAIEGHTGHHQQFYLSTARLQFA